MKTNELLQLDLITMMTSRPTRAEAEVLADRVVGLIYDAIQEVTVNILIEHIRTFDHFSLKGNPNVG